MKGIEKITARIAADAETENQAIREESAKRCAQIRAEYEKQAQEKCAAITQEGERESEQRASRIDRTARLESKKSILAMKQDLVSKAFDQAETMIGQLPEPDYIGFLARQASQAALTGQEEVILSREDKAKCGAKVVKAANDMLQARGLQPALTLSEETRPMAGGLILKQGDIEVNCTVGTLLELSRGELAAQVAEVLFEG